MGIVVAIIYLPLYLIFSIGSLIAIAKINKSVKNNTNAQPRFKHHLMGFITSNLLIIFSLWLVPVNGNTDYEAFFVQLFMTLLIPTALSILLASFSKNYRAHQKPLYIGSITGILFSLIAFPWIMLFILSISKNFA